MGLFIRLLALCGVSKGWRDCGLPPCRMRVGLVVISEDEAFPNRFHLGLVLLCAPAREALKLAQRDQCHCSLNNLGVVVPYVGGLPGSDRNQLRRRGAALCFSPDCAIFVEFSLCLPRSARDLDHAASAAVFEFLNHPGRRRQARLISHRFDCGRKLSQVSLASFFRSSFFFRSLFLEVLHGRVMPCLEFLQPLISVDVALHLRARGLAFKAIAIPYPVLKADRSCAYEPLLDSTMLLHL